MDVYEAVTSRRAVRGFTDRHVPVWAYAHEREFERLIDLLVDVSTEYLAGQAAQGADAVQIFDSWAGSLPDAQFERGVIAPTRRLAAASRARHPKLPIIGYPRGAGALARGRRSKAITTLQPLSAKAASIDETGTAAKVRARLGAGDTSRYATRAGYLGQ